MIALYLIIGLFVGVFTLVVLKNREIEVFGETFEDEPGGFIFMCFVVGVLWILAAPIFILYTLANFIIKPKKKEDAKNNRYFNDTRGHDSF